MTCRDVECLVVSLASGVSIPPAASAHIADCERCQRLVWALGEAREVEPLSPELLKRIKTRTLSDLKPATPLPAAGVLTLVLVSILLAIAAAGGVTLGTAGWRVLSLLQRASVFTALIAAASLLAFSTARQILPGSRLVLSPYLLVTAAIGVMAAICIALFRPQEESAFVSTGLVCLRIGLGFAISATFLFWLLLRRGAILNPMLMGATAGTLAGLSGLAVLEIFCPILDRYHILAWHLGTVLTSAAAGLAIGIVAEYSSWRRPARTP